MTVVSDTSVLIHLARINRFPLLRQLYDEIIVPRAVWRETVDKGEERPGAPEAQSAREAGWLKVAAVEENVGLRRLLLQALDAGEADTLTLAHQIDADLVLLDESAARHRAEGLRLRKTGSIGVLLRAKRKGLIDAVRPELDALRATSFWVDEALFQRVLDAAGEHPG